MSKWKCKTPHCKKSCYAEVPEHHKPINCVFDGRIPDWRKEDEPVTNCNQLPKLTAEVFDREYCPAWAKYAAVDEGGVAYYYAEEPYARKHTFGSWDSMETIDGTFDASDWQNSLIERPEPEFPEWCQKGKWVCTYDRFKKGWEYFKINETKRNCISSDNGLEYSFYDLKQARVRPWTAREAIGKIVCWKGDYSFQENMATINAVDCDGDLMGDLLGNINLKDLTKKCFYQLDGKPCGVLERLENGEWVE